MEGRDEARREPHEVTGGYVPQPGEVVYDHRWARELHSSVRCAVALLVMLLLIDWASGAADVWRAVLWCALSLLLFLVLCPRRVFAGEGWLASRGLLRIRRVRTDLLVSVHCVEGVSRRLVFRDACGGQVEIDPRVLEENPALWYRLHDDVCRSAAHGLLLSDTTALHDLEERIDRETALAVFRVSGLE
ncbi:hypothetical protein SY2F82_67190 [Streptomyces sp. Y2F8-2]|uniref:hypothetical protein n=1 Tax=Streptomyces sp. Y2F8-2 TaxID=2759675 RepID=UPI001A406DAA|nr:hypothetical protein [Streptomyces sp. Y2F8-2]GHK04922.1 hypothetical protein SY2F82_67190 [Streptomyces sp. Y2F8-2]